VSFSLSGGKRKETPPQKGSEKRVPGTVSSPPTMCTAPDPAKSIAPLWNSSGPLALFMFAQPLTDQTECTMMGYTQAAIKNE